MFLEEPDPTIDDFDSVALDVTLNEIRGAMPFGHLVERHRRDFDHVVVALEGDLLEPNLGAEHPEPAGSPLIPSQRERAGMVGDGYPLEGGVLVLLAFEVEE